MVRDSAPATGIRVVPQSMTAQIARQETPIDLRDSSRAFVEQLHKLEGTNPGLAASMALEDRARDPDGPHAEERDMVLVTALSNDRDYAAATREARYYFSHYPQGQFTDFVSRLTRLSPQAPVAGR